MKKFIKKFIKFIAKFILGLSITVGFIALGLFLGMKALSLFKGQDIERPDLSEIIVSEKDIKREENSYYDLIKISEEYKTIEQSSKLLASYTDIDAWTNDEIMQILSEQEKFLGYLSDAAGKEYFLNPSMAKPETMTPQMPVIPLNVWREVARLKALEAVWLTKNGDSEAGFASAFDIIKVGHTLQSSRVTLIAYLVGTSIKNTGLEAIHQCISYTNLPSEELAKYRKQLSNYYAPDNIEFIKAESTFLINSFDQMINETLKEHGLLKKNNYYYKPNQSLAYIADNHAKHVENFNKPCHEMPVEYLERQAAVPVWKMYFTENIIGKMINDVASLMIYNSVRDKKCENDMLLAAGLTMLGLKQYQFENNEIASDINDLERELIMQEVSDPFSGDDFGYSSSRLIVYSVGRDREDVGGSDPESNWSDAMDPTFSVDFAVTESRVDENLDTDNDGLTDTLENEYGTDPQIADTDGDGYSDGDEVANGYNPNGEGVLVVKKEKCEDIINENEAEASRLRTACYLNAGDLDNALKGFDTSEKNRIELLMTLDSEDLQDLAFTLKNAELIDDDKELKSYSYTWVDDDEEENFVNFYMVKNFNNNWVISSW